MERLYLCVFYKLLIFVEREKKRALIFGLLYILYICTERNIKFIYLK